MKQRFIISRVDAIGDVVLTLPVATILKKNFPDCEVIFLARDYVQAIVQACPDVDQFVSWDKLQQLPRLAAIRTLRELQADTIIHIKPNMTLAWLTLLAGIKTRIGTSRRWFHWLTCNRRVAFSRAKSDLHEAQLNLKLLAPLNINSQLPIQELHQIARLQTNQPPNDNVQRFLAPDKFNLLVHPLSHGHGREWPLDYFVALIQSLAQERFNVILTGSKAEYERLKQPVIARCPQLRNAAGQLSLAELLVLMQHADGIVVGSTGPLHMAAAMGIHTLGLFPPKKIMSAHRWGPIGPRAQYLMENKACDDCNLKLADQCACMRLISVAQVKQTIMQWASA